MFNVLKGSIFMLHEKYKPKNASEAIGLNSTYESVKQWLKGWKKSDYLILHGTSGCGKNMLIDLLAKEMKLEKIDIVAIDQTTVAQCKQRSLMGNNKIVIVDEPTSAKGISDLIKESCFPVIITTIDLYKSQLQNLRRNATIIEIRKVRYDSIAKYLERICKQENINCPEKTILLISQKCKGDVRGALLDLETASEKIESRDVNDSVFNTLGVIFRSFDVDTIKDAVKSCDKPLNELFWWIENNAYRAYSDREEIAEAYEYLALADMFSVYSRRTKAMMKYQLPLAVLAVSLSKRQPLNCGFMRYMPPMTRTKSKKMIPVLNKIAVKMHTTTKKAEGYVPLMKIIGTLDEFGFDKEEIKLLK